MNALARLEWSTFSLLLSLLCLSMVPQTSLTRSKLTDGSCPSCARDELGGTSKLASTGSGLISDPTFEADLSWCGIAAGTRAWPCILCALSAFNLSAFAGNLRARSSRLRLTSFGAGGRTVGTFSGPWPDFLEVFGSSTSGSSLTAARAEE